MGRSSRFRGVLTAIMPQPMSTPTAAGMTAPLVGMQEPTVAPSPKWQSGMTAMCLKMNGIFEMFSIWARAWGSIWPSGTQVRARWFICVGMVFSPSGLRVSLWPVFRGVALAARMTAWLAPEPCSSSGRRRASLASVIPSVAAVIRLAAFPAAPSPAPVGG